MARSEQNNNPWPVSLRLPIAVKALLLLALLPASFAAHGQAPLPEELQQLIREARYAEAWETALVHRPQWEGELVFDFLYGVAAARSGQLSEGVFALERVVMRRPDFSRARLELARAYFLREEDVRAGHHFDIVLSQNPSPQVVASIERYRQRMLARSGRQSTAVSGHIGMAFGHDSNVNSATANDTVAWVWSDLFGDLQLGEEAREKGDLYLPLSGSVNVSRTVSARQAVFLRGDLESRSHRDESDFNTVRGGIRFGTTFTGDTLRPTLALRLQRFYLDGERYQDLSGVSVGLAQQLSGVLLANYSAQYLRMRYDDRSERDADLLLGSAGLTRVWQHALRPAVNVSLFVGEEDARDSGAAAKANTDRRLYGISGMLRLQPAPKWAVTGRAQYRRSDYGGDNAIFGKTRREDFRQIALELDWAPSARWRIGPRLQYSNNAANIDLFEYDRSAFEIQARYNFF